MAKTSVHMSLTLDMVNKRVQFAKIDAGIEDIDLDEDFGVQIGNFDKAFDAACSMLGKKLKEKAKRSWEKEQ